MGAPKRTSAAGTKITQIPDKKIFYTVNQKILSYKCTIVSRNNYYVLTINVIYYIYVRLTLFYNDTI